MSILKVRRGSSHGHLKVAQMKPALYCHQTVTASSRLTQATPSVFFICLSGLGFFMVNVLTAENVTKYAQDIMPLMPLDCEWGGGTCESELNSWSALREVSATFMFFSFNRCIGDQTS